MCKQTSIQGSSGEDYEGWEGNDVVHCRRKCANVPKDPSARYPSSTLRTNGTGIPNNAVSRPATLLLPRLFGTRTASILIGKFTHINSQQTTLQTLISANLTRNSKLEEIQIQWKVTGKLELQTLLSVSGQMANSMHNHVI